MIGVVNAPLTRIGERANVIHRSSGTRNATRRSYHVPFGIDAIFRGERLQRPVNVLMLVGLGAAVGGVARYGLASGVYDRLNGALPASIALNIIASFAVGSIVEAVLIRYDAEGLRYFMKAGFCGGFTNLAAFTPEVMSFINRHDYEKAGLYAFGSIVLASLSVTLGAAAARRVRT
jgi:CrcB protein